MPPSAEDQRKQFDLLLVDLYARINDTPRDEGACLVTLAAFHQFVFELVEELYREHEREHQPAARAAGTAALGLVSDACREGRHGAWNCSMSRCACMCHQPAPRVA